MDFLGCLQATSLGSSKGNAPKRQLASLHSLAIEKLNEVSKGDHDADKLRAEWLQLLENLFAEDRKYCSFLQRKIFLPITEKHFTLKQDCEEAHPTCLGIFQSKDWDQDTARKMLLFGETTVSIVNAVVTAITESIREPNSEVSLIAVERRIQEKMLLVTGHFLDPRHAKSIVAERVGVGAFFRGLFHLLLAAPLGFLPFCTSWYRRSAFSSDSLSLVITCNEEMQKEGERLAPAAKTTKNA